MSAFTEAIKCNTQGLEAVSTGFCAGCETCRKEWGRGDMTEQAARDAVESCEIVNEPHFSWSPCVLCGSRLGGDREDAHAVLDGELVHLGGACVDCMIYLANGDEPVDWPE